MHQRSELRPSIINLVREEEEEEGEKEEGSPREADRTERKEERKEGRKEGRKEERRLDRIKTSHARPVCTLSQRETYASRTPIHELIVREHSSFKDIDCNLGSLLASSRMLSPRSEGAHPNPASVRLH